MSIRWWIFGVWAAAAASAACWGFMLFVATPPLARIASSADAPPVAATGDLTRLLGADAPPAPKMEPPLPDARFHLAGVISARPTTAHEGLALIGIDGKPPRLFHVGAVVEGQNVLQAVDARSVSLGPRDGSALMLLSLAPPVSSGSPSSTETAMPPAPVPSLSLASIQRSAPGTQQELFQQRQQLQFEQEQLENQRPEVSHPNDSRQR